MSKYNRDDFITPFDSLFDDLLASHFPKLNSDLGGNFFAKGSYPRVDVIEKPDKLVLEAEIHGLTKEDITVELEGENLVIKGCKRQKEGNGSEKYLLRQLLIISILVEPPRKMDFASNETSNNFLRKRGICSNEILSEY